MSVFNQPFNDQSPSCFDFCNITPRPIRERLPNHHRQENVLLATEDQQKAQENDAMIAKALSRLTFQERERHQEMLHGVEEKVVEDEALVERALEDLELYLSSIKGGSSYEMAEIMDPGYVHARPFCVMFLRANEYNAQAAADHMLRFFDSKHELFGKEKLVKDITMRDLDEQDIASIKTGYIQHSGNDRSGRQILVHSSGAPGFFSSSMTIKNRLRGQYYTIMKALQSEETQLRGIVSIWFAFGNVNNKTKGKDNNKLFASASALPQKKASIHICVDDVYEYIYCHAAIKLMRGDLRARLRVHFGSRFECEYNLTSYGIMSPSLPIDAQGRMDTSRHLSWVRACAIEDNAIIHPSILASREVDSNTSIQPNLNDVLFGGGKYVNHDGNKYLRALIKDYSHSYGYGSDETKRQIVALIISKIHEHGGRFLKRAPHDPAIKWEIVSDETELRAKVMQSFRNRRKINSDANQTKSIDMLGTLINGGPLSNDVIFGKITRRNPGTDLLHHLIRDHFEQYESLDRGVKMVLVERIMHAIEDQGGRFLQQAADPGKWVELSHDHAKERISKYFRNYRRQAARKTM